MNYDDVRCTKSMCEKYTLRFNSGWDYAVITIDDTGIFQCHSSFGDYAYNWNAFGEDFKEFLCRINTYYLIDKIADKNYFDFQQYEAQVKRVILQERKDRNLTAEEARELWDFITNEIEHEGSYDLVCNQIYSNHILSKLYCGEVFYSDFSPEQDYSPNAKAFAFKIFPKFVEILKQELGEENDRRDINDCSKGN